MSNYNFESPRGYEGRIIGGPEVVNGTGQVRLRFYESAEPDQGEAVFIDMPAEDCLNLAGWLSRLAFEAMHVKWKEDNLTHG